MGRARPSSHPATGRQPGPRASRRPSRPAGVRQRNGLASHPRSARPADGPGHPRCAARGCLGHGRSGPGASGGGRNGDVARDYPWHREPNRDTARSLNVRPSAPGQPAHRTGRGQFNNGQGRTASKMHNDIQSPKSTYCVPLARRFRCPAGPGRVVGAAVLEDATTNRHPSWPTCAAFCTTRSARISATTSSAMSGASKGCGSWCARPSGGPWSAGDCPGRARSPRPGRSPRRSWAASCFYRAGMASFGPTSLNRAPVGSAASARRPYGVSWAGLTTEPPSRVTAASVASVSAAPK